MTIVSERERRGKFLSQSDRKGRFRGEKWDRFGPPITVVTTHDRTDDVRWTRRARVLGWMLLSAASLGLGAWSAAAGIYWGQG